jgi:hypothetical protein
MVLRQTHRLQFGLSAQSGCNYCKVIIVEMSADEANTAQRFVALT